MIDMKTALVNIFKIFAVTILAAKILNWFLHFSPQTNELVNSVMFILIGIAYLVVGYKFKDTFRRMVMRACGMYLLIMNFLENNTLLTIGGILCLVIPMLMSRFYREKRLLNGAGK